jgi:two-component system sensor histidine kinase/response regulator
MEEVAAALGPMAEAKRLRLLLPPSEPALSIQTDRRALSQILLNLTNNALKFTDGGEVRLTVERRPTAEGAVVAIGVTDTGVGIRADDQPRLFQAFEQVAGGELRRREGTGLGLYLSQKLAGLLGGRIEFDSVYGQGSTFRCVLVEG